MYASPRLFRHFYFALHVEDLTRHMSHSLLWDGVQSILGLGPIIFWNYYTQFSTYQFHVRKEIITVGGLATHSTSMCSFEHDTSHCHILVSYFPYKSSAWKLLVIWLHLKHLSLFIFSTFDWETARQCMCVANWDAKRTCCTQASATFISSITYPHSHPLLITVYT